MASGVTTISNYFEPLKDRRIGVGRHGEERGAALDGPPVPMEPAAVRKTKFMIGSVGGNAKS